MRKKGAWGDTPTQKQTIVTEVTIPNNKAIRLEQALAWKQHDPWERRMMEGDTYKVNVKFDENTLFQIVCQGTPYETEGVDFASFPTWNAATAEARLVQKGKVIAKTTQTDELFRPWTLESPSKVYTVTVKKEQKKQVRVPKKSKRAFKEDKNMNTTLETIKVADIFANITNPRKDLGDLTELTDSIKTNGLMQNITVMRGKKTGINQWEDEGYTLLIGHRRTEACRLAGLTEVPCKVIDRLPESEQMAIMLCENLQRNDLTPIEQAESFQMMLDLGETTESIAKKSGFSKRTIQRRLNIAKLGTETIGKIEDAGIQLSLNDYEKLESLPNINDRRKVLESISRREDISWKVNCIAEENKREQSKRKIHKLLKAYGFKERTNEQIYHDDWKDILRKSISDSDKLLEEIEKAAKTAEEIGTERVYDMTYNLVLYRKITEEEQKKVNNKETKKQKKQKKINDLRDKYTMLHTKKSKYIEHLLTEGTFQSKSLEDIQPLWDIVKTQTHYGFERALNEWKKTKKELPIEGEMLLYLRDRGSSFVTYEGEYREDETAKALYTLLQKQYHFTLTKEEESLLDGTHELFAEIADMTKEEQKKK